MKHFLASILLAVLLMGALHAQQPDPAWLRDKDVVAAFQSLPIQEGGRMKPLDTYARYLLLRLHGMQSIKVEHAALPGVNKLSAIEWLLLSWFRPDIARDLSLFVVDNSQAVGEIGVEPKNLRDRYSYNEIVKGKDELRKRAEAYSEIEEEKRTAVQRNLIDLARNFFEYDAASDYFAADRVDWRKETASMLPPEVAAALPKEGRLSVWDLSEHLGTFIREKGADALGSEARTGLLTLMIDKYVRPGMAMAIIPPEDTSNPTWHKLGDLITNAMSAGTTVAGDARRAKDPEAARSPKDPKEVSAGDLRRAKQKDAILPASTSVENFKAAVKTFVDDIRQQAAVRGDLKHVDREVTYYKADYFTYALVFYLLGFLIAIVGLVAPQTGWAKWMGRLAWMPLIAGLGFNIWGIVQRCIINERPPIATLYETIIFITAAIALVGLIIEVLTRQGIGITLAGFVGALGMFLSFRFMALDGQDTMPTLEAVLITNFWLATHVTCINIGYAGSLLASIVSMVYVGVRALVRGSQIVDTRRLLTRVTYGIVCFGLLFSLVGTVLGGIWANDSWGRFWGWDPKENGALMIVLMGLVILHARLGGYIREVGLHVASIILGAVTLFSWFGVNLLNIGLHSYGFIDGIWTALISAWAVQSVFILVALWFWWRERSERKLVASMKAA